MAIEQFGDRIKRLRIEFGMTQEEVALEINKRNPGTELNKSLLSRYENNIHKPKRFSVVRDMADLFSVSTDYLMCRSNDKYKQEGDITCKYIPIIGTIAAGVAILAQENIEGYECIPAEMNVDFCLRVKGNSMINARILDGDIVYIRKQPDAENGEIAAVMFGDSEEATLKRVYKYKNTVVLRSENPKYPEHEYSKKEANNIKIIGKAIFFKSEVR